MKAFHTISVPHKDILEGRLTMDVFAADLWDVYHGRGPDEYKDLDFFFRKTYLTQGLENLLGTVEKRLKGKGGDPVIQLQTPFGGGKTHSLIAMYHKATEWNTKPVVIVGEKLKTGSKAELFDTLWGIMEEQLTGSKKEFDSPIPPGGDQIRTLLEKHVPTLILVDELIPYLNNADAINVGRKSLTTLTLTFLQTLTNVVSQIPGLSMVYTTTPSNPYDRSQRGEEIVLQLQNITARREIIKTPINDEEITRIIKRRLFSDVNERNAKKVITSFMKYAEKEDILPNIMESSEYRDMFVDSYPFMPEVVNILYHRWGSFPNFQRTRGVLRFLSLVIHSLKETNIPYISLADFDLGNQEIRQELIRHIGAEFNGIIASDLSDRNSGSKKVDTSLGDAYQGLNLGTRTATTIFLYSFSGGLEHGASTEEIKLSATTVGNPSSIISEAMEQLRNKLFYLQNPENKYFFSNQPNINLILLTKMENVKDDDLVSLENDLLKESIKGDKLDVFIWQENSGNMPDSEKLKLLILKQENSEIINKVMSTKGQTPRVYRNTIFFLYPLESERHGFSTTLKRKLAYENIIQDKNLRLADEQKKELKRELDKIKSELKEAIRRLYRIVATPDKGGVKTVDLSIPTYGEQKKLDYEVYDILRTDAEILEKIPPIVIREKYLKEKSYVSTEQIYQASLKTPGETRIYSKSVLEQGISEGVQKGLFGLGELENDQPICRYFKEQPSVAFTGNEVLISEAVCLEQKQKEDVEKKYEQETTSEERGINEDDGGREQIVEVKTRNQVILKFQVPKGKVANLMGVMNLLQSKFETLEIELSARDGNISEQDYEDKIMETFRQLGIKPVDD
ncbi:MAG: DUF499 domain-containing protein [Candidatus Scalinduaceae bacterium]